MIGADPFEALAESSDINAAYRTLREPIPRAKHVVELYGFPISDQKSVPPGLLMTVMEAQEKIADLETASSQRDKEKVMRELYAIVEELEAEGLSLDVIAEEFGKDLDPFDLICHVAFDKKQVTVGG